MSIPEVSEEARKYLKHKPKGGDTVPWIAIRTVLDVFTDGGMGSRINDLLDDILPELSGTFLDVGCYGGSLYPKVRHKVSYTGIDNWPDAIRVAKTLFDGKFEVCELKSYKQKHDIVWASQLHPEVDVPTVFDHLMSLANRMLVITYNSQAHVIDGGEKRVYPNGVVGVIYRK